MRTFAAVAALLMIAVSVGSAQQGARLRRMVQNPPSSRRRTTRPGPRTSRTQTSRRPSDGCDPTGSAPTECSSNVTTPRPFRGSPIDFKLTGEECRRTPTSIERKLKCGLSFEAAVPSPRAAIVETRQDGKVVSRAIEGGESRRVTKGDFIMIPEGVPHYVTEASPELVFMAIEFPRPRAAQMPPAPSN